MTAKAGIEKHSNVAKEVLLIEFQQLHDFTVFKGIDPASLPAAQKKGALRATRSINHIKEIRYEKIKG